MDYRAFLATKAQLRDGDGFDAELPDSLFPFQRHLTSWALQHGRAGIFADTGLGKTPMELAWGTAVAKHTGKPVLLLTPLAVTSQTVREAAKFGVDAARSTDGKVVAPITVTNYERLHHFNPDDFGGVAGDESSAIKAFDGKRRAMVTEFMRTVRYRSLWTATPSPNDFIELGTSSEALGELGQMDMLNRFFKNDQNNSSMKAAYRTTGGGAARWRFKGHAEEPFWRWVCSWARACRKPSDLGFDDDGFILPPLIEREHTVEARQALDGYLFTLPAKDFRDERVERRRTIKERCELAASLVADTEPAVVWCHLNDEGDLLSKLIPGAVEVSGATSDDAKEEAYTAFSAGQIRVLIIKPKIGAWGLNWQHCAHVVTFASHSYEQYYQAVRRCWRFGQKRPVVVDVIASEGEERVKASMDRKAAAADRMFTALVARMNDAQAIRPGQTYTQKETVPSWLTMGRTP